MGREENPVEGGRKLGGRRRLWGASSLLTRAGPPKGTVPRASGSAEATHP